MIGLFGYDFKLTPEAIWALVIVAATTLAQVVTAADPSVVIADPKTWVVSAVAAVIRALAGVILGGKE